MTLRLVKTTGGSDGAPVKCESCGFKDFVRSRVAWSCSNCSKYIPVNFDTPNAVERLKRDIEVLDRLQNEFKLALDDLEKLVRT